MDILEALRKAKTIQDQYKSYCVGSGGFPINLEYLIDVVEAYTELKIKVLSVGYEPVSIHARLCRFPKRAEIHVASKLNTCYERYAVTKELSQLIIDTPDSFTQDFKGLVTGLVFETTPLPGIVRSNALQSENISHVVACEILLPCNMRNGYIDKVNSGETSYYKIALQHRMPEAIVTQILFPPVNDAMQAIMAGV